MANAKKATKAKKTTRSGGPYAGETYTGLKVYRQKSTGRLRTHR